MVVEGGVRVVDGDGIVQEIGGGGCFMLFGI